MSAPVFNDIRTRRLTISLKELDIGNAIALARFPSEDFERTTTAFLNAVVKNCDGVADNLDWTVQERTLAVCQYLAANNGDTPDFALGYEGHYSDYLAAETDVELDTDGNLKTLALGLIGDDDWQLRPLTGRMAQAVERLRGEVTLPDGGELSGYAHWELGCMAAQLFLPGDSAPPDTDGLYDEWLVHRMQVLLIFPKSVYEQLREAFYGGWSQQRHLFNLGLSDDGIVVLPKEAGSELPPARFRIHTLLIGAAQNLA